MSKVLFVNSCPRDCSRTLMLAESLLDRLGNDYEEIKIYQSDIKPLDNDSLEYRTAKINANDYFDSIFDLAKQFANAETVVIGAPFWDLSFPSVLKVYFENIMISGLTFTYKNGRPEGLCKTKKLYYVTTSGGYIFSDFGFSYVKSLAENFFGIPEIKCFDAQGLDIVGNDGEQIIKNAIEKINCEIK